MAAYCYDIECFDSLFTVIFIPATKQINHLLDKYEFNDINNIDNTDTIKEIGIKKFIIDYNLKHNDAVLLASWLVKEKPLLYGYNNHNYDDLLLNAIIMYAGSNKFGRYEHITKTHTVNGEVTEYKVSVGTTIFLREISDSIINSMDKNFQYSEDSMLKRLATYNSPFTSIDLQKLNYISTISLKFIGILLKHYRIQDLPYYNVGINRYVTEEEIEGTLLNKVIDYNINDVLITKKLLHFSKKEIVIRLETTRKYNVNVMSDSRSSMANKLIELFYTEVTGQRPNKHKQTIRNVIPFGELIEPVIQFKTDEFNEFLTMLKATRFRMGHDKFNPALIYKGVKYQLGVGGIHSADRGMSIVTDGTYSLIDVDANSYYPFTILNYKVHPAHIPDIHYLPMLKKIVYERIEAKMKAKDKSNPNWKDYKSKADILKIVVNIIYGKLGAVMHWLLDHAAMYKVTLNCQLGLLMLIEDLTSANFQVISTNTDGIVSKVPNERRDEYFAICEAWTKKLNYGVEYTEYKEYYATNVNNYLAIKTNGEVKAKGAFVKDKTGLHDFLMKGYDMPIVAIAVYEYLVNKIPVQETIKKHTDIYDFCKAQRIGGNYTPYAITLQDGQLKYTKLQKTIRYFVSTNGVSIVKVNPDATKKLKTGTVVNTTREISLLAKRRLTLFNDFIHYDDIADYKIDYGYYVSEANKLIYTIKGVYTKVTNYKKTTGTLFD